MTENPRPPSIFPNDPVVVDPSMFIPERIVSDKDMIAERYNYQFINNIFADFVKATADYFGDLYAKNPNDPDPNRASRFQHKVIGTYDKAVEYINKIAQYSDRVPDKPNLPALVLNPTGDFGLDETASGARQINFRFPNLAPGLISRLYDPIYEDNDVRVCVGFTRLKGEFEMIALLPSFYEYFDLKVLLIQMFGDVGRVIYPQWFNSFLILPSELYLYEYKNPYTGVVHTLDWSKAKVAEELVKSTNKNEMVVPVRMRPLYKLISLADASTRYGGADKLADWKLGFTVEYQLEMPSMMMILTDHLIENVKLEVRHVLNYSSATQYDVNIYPSRDILKLHWDVTIDSTSEDYFQVVVGDVEEVEDKSLTLTNTYIHVVTKQEADSTSDIIIDLPEQIDSDKDVLLVLSTYGYMDYKDHYDISEDGWKLTIKKEFVSLVEDQIIQLIYYKKDAG
jgi:hypothetical protein